MEVKVTVSGSLAKTLRKRTAAAEKEVTRAVTDQTVKLKTAWRGQVAGALGARLGNAVQAKVYPEGEASLDAAGLVYTKAPKIIAGHERGALIRAHGGLWLAIPASTAGRGPKGKKMLPGEWSAKTGRKLTFVPTGPGRAVLVADDVRINKRGRAVARRPGRSRYEAKRQNTVVPIFFLIRQAKLPKRLNLIDAARAAQGPLTRAVRVALKTSFERG